MVVLNYLKEYWFLVPTLLGFIVFAKSMIEATKCSLRNDILTIYESCKKTKTITQFQLDAILHSADVYFKIGGNSFVKQIVELVKTFKIVD